MSEASQGGRAGDEKAAMTPWRLAEAAIALDIHEMRRPMAEPSGGIEQQA